MEKIEKEERSSKNVLLKDPIHGKDGLYLNYYENFTKNGKDTIKKLAKHEKIINYNDLFFLKQVIPSLKTLIFKKDLVHCMIY